MALTEEQELKLNRAAGLLAEVQLQLLRFDNEQPEGLRTKEWAELLTLRLGINDFILRTKRDVQS